MTDAQAAASRGRALLDLGRAKEAETQLRAALATHPGDADLHFGLAHALQLQDRHAEARDVARGGLAIEPSNVMGLMVLAAAHAGLEQYPAALEVVDTSLRIAPLLPVLHRQRGAILMALERHDEGIDSLGRARSLDPDDAQTVALLAGAYFNARRYDESASAVDDALALDPQSPGAHRVRGLLSLRKGGGRQAVDAHRQALRHDPTDEHVREGLSVAMKSRNPIYGLLLRYAAWQEGLPGGVRWISIVAPFIATRVMRPFEDQLWAKVLLGVVFAWVFLTWTIEPIMNSLLLCSMRTRNLLPRTTKLATCAFLAYLATALACVLASWMTGSDKLMYVALALGFLCVSAGMAHTIAEKRQQLARRLHAGAAGLAVIGVVTAATGGTQLWMGLLMFVGIGLLWFTAFA